ncbi:MAG: hypothetical protein WBD55_02840 [Dehalococcoidia bacterium]
MSRTVTTLSIEGALLLLCAGATLSLACGLVGGGDDSSTATNTTPNATAMPAIPAEAALERYVERRLLQGFVRNCDDAERPNDIAKQCARYRGTKDGLVAYALGPTFSPYTRLIILEPAGDTWSIVHLEVREPGDPPVPGIPWPLRIGATIVVAGTDSCLQTRERPGLQAGSTACLENGTAATITQGPVDIDDHEWWFLEGYGWSSSNWLRYPDEAATPEATETPEE